ncbi:MAG: AmpG family muropeptide MFS transporter [Oscillatoriales cyanobacterium SM2_2_1]|nr:AmpG family muropeptide MFS transporter [Oscillatoriales cyanobacterium SM2_2_1]
MLVMLTLGFSSGLPFVLVDDAFRAWMGRVGLDLRTIGWLGLVTLPYSVKFLWSPVVDRFVPPFWGRRRGWMALMQVALVVVLMAIALLMSFYQGAPLAQRTGWLQGLAIALVVAAFLSATQDIVIDAYRTDVLLERETGMGVGVWVTGYRVALITAGVLGFNLADSWGWPWVYGMLALVLGTMLAATWWAPQESPVAAVPLSLDRAVTAPLQELWQRLGGRKLGLVVAFVVLYRLGDGMVGKMAVPFLQQLQFEDGEIGTIRQGLGLAATVVGTLAGGVALSQWGMNRSLWVFGWLQALSNLSYGALAIAGKNYAWFLVAINVENFCGGLGTAGFLGYLMSLCHPSYSATQYALLSSLFAVGRDVLGSPLAGELAVRSPGGWAGFFMLTTAMALPGLALLPWVTAAEKHQDMDMPD